MTDLEIQDAIARISRNQAEINKIDWDVKKIALETKIMPWQVVVTALGAGAALFAAGGVFFNILLHH